MTGRNHPLDKPLLLRGVINSENVSIRQMNVQRGILSARDSTDAGLSEARHNCGHRSTRTTGLFGEEIELGLQHWLVDQRE